MAKKKPNMKNLVLMGFHHTPRTIQRYMICQAVTMAIVFVIYYSWNGGIVPKFLLKKEPLNLNPGSKLIDHFPETLGDGSKVKWGHGTNERSSLLMAIQDPRVMMLEGDIHLKGQGSKAQQLLPVMVQRTSQEELTFKDWLQVALESKKGIKLDFKTIEPIEICLQILSSKKSEVKNAVHISADILEGPNSAKSEYKPVDHHRFLRLVTTHFPESTLVVGWTEESSEPTRYTWDMVKQMFNAVAGRKIKQPVAITVSAQFIKQSLSQIKWLSEMLDSQITIYSMEKDKINTNDLLFVRHKFSKETVYYDLHNKLSTSFDQTKDDTKQIAKEMMESNLVLQAEHWKVIQTDGSRIYLGTEAVVIQKGLMVYNEDPYVFTNEPLKIRGRVEFFDIPVKSETHEDIGVAIFLHSPSNAGVKTLSGVKLFIGLTGKISASPYGLKGVTEKPEPIQIDGTSPCFIFEITEIAAKTINLQIWRPINCDVMAKTKHESSHLGEIQLNIANLPLNQKHIAILAENTLGFAAIDSFVISS